VLLLGTDQQGQPIREVLALTLPPAPGKSNTPATRVARAPGASAGSAGSAIPIRVHSNLIYVSAVVNGVTVSLVLDTGAQVTVLSPDAASRLGIVVSPDAAVLAVAGIGVAEAPIVIVPALRVGDYVVENIPVAVTTGALMSQSSGGFGSMACSAGISSSSSG
jgi:clan AA aspartic protease (TIGR02281 family)